MHGDRSASQMQTRSVPQWLRPWPWRVAGAAVALLAGAAVLAVLSRWSSGTGGPRVWSGCSCGGSFSAMGLFIVYMLVVGVLLEEILDLDAEIESVVRFGLDPFGFFLALIPISVGLAILRYRLYDIDRLISRTLSYGLITAVLLACFAGAVFLSSRLFPRQSDLGVAASTLAVAALFNPVRRRIQSAVDRRFNRSRYDAARVVDAFGHRLRSKAGIEDLTGELITAPATTMQPTASLWLKRPRP